MKLKQLLLTTPRVCLRTSCQGLLGSLSSSVFRVLRILVSATTIDRQVLVLSSRNFNS